MLTLLMRNTFKLLGIGLMVGGILSGSIGFGANQPGSMNEIMFFGGMIMIYLGVIILGIIFLRS